MSDSLVFGVFRELAVMRGLRSPTGSWKNVDEKKFAETLHLAMRMVKNQEALVEKAVSRSDDVVR